IMEVSFSELMEDAEKRNYAVGYFESWNLESLLGVCDAAENMKSPVILGFGGLFLTNERRAVKEKINIYSTLAKQACKNISVPACSIFNESGDFNSVLDSIDDGYDVVMFVDSSLSLDELTDKVSRIASKAHANSVAVEAEIDELPGLDAFTGNIIESRLSDPGISRKFVDETGIDSLSINIGQSHKTKKIINMDFGRLKKIKEAVKIPLVLHGGTNMSPDEINKAIDMGIRKFNLGRVLKDNYFDALSEAIKNIGKSYNIYEVIGSGFREDVLVKARFAVQKTVEKYMELYRSAGKA
ncbi:MAG: class II fructose-bisphosphate aldolase, partial [Actinobacteria bacterium]|nr:class II fructose-bisphosphate aldolase [Actinomycetota bacterium]